MHPIIEFRDVTVTYPVKGSKETFDAVKEVSLSIEAGTVIALIGGSGAGKSTLARLINLLSKPSSGQVLIDGVDIARLSAKEVRKVRTGIGMIFQHFNLLNSLTVYANIEFALETAGWPRERHRDRIAELLHFVGLAEKAWSYPQQLSGGQKQRVGIARALATNPKILLADESTSALDPQTTNDVLQLLRRVNEELGVTIVVITHELDVVRRIAHRVAVLDRGRLVEHGEVYEIFARPREALTARLVQAAVAERPSEQDAAELRAGGVRLVSVSVDEQHRIGAVLAEVVRTSDLGFEFVYGGVSRVQGKSLGEVTLALTGSDQAVEAAIAALRAAGEVGELR